MWATIGLQRPAMVLESFVTLSSDSGITIASWYGGDVVGQMLWVKACRDRAGFDNVGAFVCRFTSEVSSWHISCNCHGSRCENPILVCRIRRRQHLQCCLFLEHRLGGLLVLLCYINGITRFGYRISKKMIDVMVLWCIKTLKG